MPITYTPAKTAQQAPAANPAPNGPTILDAADYNTMNEGIAAVTAFANGLETSIADKADASAIPDVSGFQTAEQVESAITAATSTLATQASVDALETTVEGKADASAIPDVSAFQTEAQVNSAIATATADLATKTELAAKADTTALADYAQIDELASAADAATSGAAGIGAYYDGAASTTQAVIDALVARIAALETPG